MCGIAGFVRFSGRTEADDRPRLEAMVATLIHRGPDSAGMDQRDGVSLGMRRLSIIDLEGGQQPIYNEDHSVWTVYNGEIYNFPELKQELQAKGHLFRTGTDTEIIVHGYEEWGQDFPLRLNGMFAIALHDAKNNKFLLVRDHLGIKPLYYSYHPDRLIFGSEIKALLASTWIDREIDLQGVADFLAWEYTPGRTTLFRAVRKLLPGEMICLDLRMPSLQPKSYWDIPHHSTSDPSLPSTAWEERILAQVRQSTRMQMISDVPLGAFLSGGVDSSLIAACMGRVQTFSIGFDDPSYNELGWARKVAAHLGVDHHDEVIHPDVIDLFDHLMHFMDDPIGDFSIFPTYLVSKLARRHVTVALSGDGGDELFAGYESYLAQEKAKFYNRLPCWMRADLLPTLAEHLRPTAKKKGVINKLKRFIEGAARPVELGHARWRLFATDEMLNRLFTAEAARALVRPAAAHILELFDQAGDCGPLDRCLYVDVKSYLCDNILTKVDRMSMAVSLESRVPYLDKDLVALAFQVPERLKLTKGETKTILKRVAAQLVPRDCIYRPKEGFSIPIKHWLNGQFKPLLDDLLNESSIRRDGLFHWPVIERLKSEHHQGTHNHSHLLWALIVFHDWKRRWQHQ